ncbi:MAG: hypothetical protein ACRCVU_02875 [Flavobacterium sp.]
MKIVNIFAYRLFAFHYEGEEFNEYDRLLDLWGNIGYLYEFLKLNKQDIPRGRSLEDIVIEISEDADFIDSTLVKMIDEVDKSLSHFFKPLHNLESGVKVLSLQKGKTHCLRMYAIKIDIDTFIITGGTIKLPLQHLMKDRSHTTTEIQKLYKAKAYLNAENVFDEDSFFELLNEK